MSTPGFGRPLDNTSRFRSARRGGFTLIEVAIALAIFVFGALAIVQIFPPALGVIRNNESRVAATQLSENTLALFKSKATPPPEAIFDAVFNTTTTKWEWQDVPLSVVGTSNKNGSLAKTILEFDSSAMNRFRYMYGEPHYIAAGQQVLLNRSYDGGVLSFFYDRKVEGVQLSEDGYLDFTNAYIVDGNGFDGAFAAQTTPFNNGSTRPPTNYRRTGVAPSDVVYYVSYRWRESTTPTIIRGVLEEPISIPPDAGWDTNASSRVLPCVINSANKVVPGTVQVRMRRGVGLPSTVVNGIIYTSSAHSGLYYANYLSKDWRELRDDSAPNNNVVKLPIKGIEEGSVAGTLTNANSSIVPIAATMPFPIASVDYKEGAVTYSFANTPGARIRTTYRTLDGWATQTSVAPRTYVPFANLTALTAGEAAHFPREPWREYAWSAADPSNIYFHASEAGKTVAISYGVGNVPTKTTLTIDNIQDAPVGMGGAGNFAPSGKVARATLVQPNGDPATTTTAILSVQGLSVHARTAWLNADKYNQVIVPGYRNLLQ